MGRALDVARSEVGADGLGPLLAGPCAAPGRLFQVRPISPREPGRAGGGGHPAEGPRTRSFPTCLRSGEGGRGTAATVRGPVRVPGGVPPAAGFPRDPLGSWGDAGPLAGAPGSSICPLCKPHLGARPLSSDSRRAAWSLLDPFLPKNGRSTLCRLFTSENPFLFLFHLSIKKKKSYKEKKCSQPENSEERKGKIICKLSKSACRRIYVFEHRNSLFLKLWLLISFSP